MFHDILSQREHKLTFALVSAIYTPTLLYRGIYCIAAFAHHVNFRAQRPLVIIYVQGKCQTLISSKNCAKISSILVSKIITLQKSRRKRVFAQTGYTLPIKCPLSPSNIHCFLFSSNCDLSAGCQSLRSVTRSRYLLIWKL